MPSFLDEISPAIDKTIGAVDSGSPNLYVPEFEEIEESEAYRMATPEQKLKVKENWARDRRVQIEMARAEQAKKRVEEIEASGVRFHNEAVASAIPWEDIVNTESYRVASLEQKKKLRDQYIKDFGIEPGTLQLSQESLGAEFLKGITEDSALGERFGGGVQSAPIGVTRSVARMAGSAIGDMPENIVGGVAGALATFGNPYGATFGAFALPEATRSYYRAKRLGQLQGKKRDVATSAKEAVLRFGRAMASEMKVAEAPELGTPEEGEQTLVETDIVRKAVTMGVAGMLSQAGVSLVTKAAGAPISQALVKQSLAGKNDEVSSIIKAIRDKGIEGVWFTEPAKRAAALIDSGEFAAAEKLIRKMNVAQSMTRTPAKIVAETAPLVAVPTVVEGEELSPEAAFSALILGTTAHGAAKIGGKIGARITGKRGGDPLLDAITVVNDKLRSPEVRSEIVGPSEKTRAIPKERKIGVAESDLSAEKFEWLARNHPRAIEIALGETFKPELSFEKGRRTKLKEVIEAEIKAIQDATEAETGVRPRPRDILSAEDYAMLTAKEKVGRAMETETLRKSRAILEDVNIKLYSGLGKELSSFERQRVVAAAEKMFKQPMLMQKAVDPPKHVINVAKQIMGAEDPAGARVYMAIKKMLPQEKNTKRELSALRSEVKAYLQEKLASEPPRDITRFASFSSKEKTMVPKQSYVDRVIAEVQYASGIGRYVPRAMKEAGLEEFKRFVGKSSVGKAKEVPKMITVYGTNFGHYATVSNKKVVAYSSARPGETVVKAKVPTADLYYTQNKYEFMYMPSSKSITKMKAGKQTIKFEDGAEVASAMMQYDALMRLRENSPKIKTTNEIDDFLLWKEGDSTAKMKYDVAEAIEGEGWRHHAVFEELSGDSYVDTNVKSAITAGAISAMKRELASRAPISEWAKGKFGRIGGGIGGTMEMLQTGSYFYEELGQFSKKFYQALRQAEANSMRMRDIEIARANKYIFGKLKPEQRTFITYALQMQNEKMADLYKALGVEHRRDPGRRMNPDQLMAALTPEERIAAGRLVDEYGRWFDMINDARVACGRKPIPRTSNYMPIMDKKQSVGFISRMFDLMDDGVNMVDLDLGDVEKVVSNSFDPEKVVARQVPWSAVKKRAYRADVLELDAKKVFERYISTGSRYVQMTPLTTKMIDLLSVDTVNGNTFRMVESAAADHNKNAIIHSVNWVLMGARASDPSFLSRNEFLRKMINFSVRNTVASVIPFNPNVVINQLPAMRNTLALLGPRSFGRFAEILSTVWLEPKKIKADLNESASLYTRWANPYHELEFGFGKMRKKITDFGSFPMRAVDMGIAVATYRAAKEKYLSRFPGKVREAIQYADDLVVRTQASTMRVDKAQIQRGTLGSALTLFCNYSIAEWNLAVSYGLGARRNAPLREKLLTASSLFAGTLAMNYFYEVGLGAESMYPAFIHRYYDMVEQGRSVNETALSMAGEAMKVFPVFQGARVGGSLLGSVASMYDNVLRGAADPKQAERGMWSLYYLMGIPGMAWARRAVRAAKRDADWSDYFVTKKNVKEKKDGGIEGRLREGTDDLRRFQKDLRVFEGRLD